MIFDKTRKKLKAFMGESPRAKKMILYANLWVTPLYYTVAAILLFVLATLADQHWNLAQYLPLPISIEYQLTQTLLSTLTSGILSLTTFTFYGVLSALTTFSAQFSPRILKNFMMNNVTQRTLGIFIGSFHYVLLSLLFITQETSFFFIPMIATILAVVSTATFIIFINHIVTWLQVTNMTDNMKQESTIIAKNLLVREMDNYRVNHVEKIAHQIPETKGQPIIVAESGYIQTINFINIVKEAKKDNVIIQLEYKVGNYAFESTPLFTFWKYGDDPVDVAKYLDLVQIGRNQNEVQDIEYSFNKLVEIAIRAIGNNDPKTATRTVYQIGDLLIKISEIAMFTPYLADNQGDLRLIIQNLNFRDYLYIGLASIRHYARKNVILTEEILKVLSAVAKVKRVEDHESIWEFAEYTTRSLEVNFIHALDREKLYTTLLDIAHTTGKEEQYNKLVRKMTEVITDKDDLEEIKRKIPMNSYEA
ncbi:DUF2254 domain-containing protein [Halobacillus massiliensis]|uniref:DUF2254 domain-containing protein n=1 Tax=Halobacillus massiliensis TaxID=1926286 RepID=UPI0009E4E860|nr:DUF2254 domain-containing protein [Halobacillus massiliensis]